MTEVHSILTERYSKSFSHSYNVIKVSYCKDSGRIATAACLADPRGDRRQTGYFVKGTEPRGKCDCHILVKYDWVTQCIADPSCPNENIKYVGLIQVERHFPIQIYVSDAQYVYKKLPSDVLPGSSDNEPFFINSIPKGDYCGISYTDRQFNRSCKEHFNYLAWLLGRKVHN
jgi:penicillin-binding protein 1A